MIDGFKILPDRTGCVHIPVTIMDVWQCSRCGRILHEVIEGDAPCLAIEATLDPPTEDLPE